jgi:hypothetical protein
LAGEVAFARRQRRTHAASLRVSLTWVIADSKGLYLQAKSKLFDSRRSVLCLLLALHSSQSYSPRAIFRQKNPELDLKPFCKLSSAPR